MYEFKILIGGEYGDAIRFWQLLPLDVWVSAAPAGLPMDHVFTLSTLHAARKLISGVYAATRDQNILSCALIIYSTGRTASELQKLADELGLAWAPGRVAA